VIFVKIYSIITLLGLIAREISSQETPCKAYFHETK